MSLEFTQPVDDSTLSLLEEMEWFESLRAIEDYKRIARDLEAGRISVLDCLADDSELLTESERDEALDALVEEWANQV